MTEINRQHSSAIPKTPPSRHATLIPAQPKVLSDSGASKGHQETKEVPSDIAPQGTFERIPFEQLMTQYEHSSRLPPTMELSQAFLMTNNMKQTASQVTSHSIGGTGYFFQNDYLADTLRLSDAMTKVSRLLGNLGPADKSTNFILEQRNLMRAQANEGRQIRDLIDQEIVDGLEYVRTKEKIAETRQRVQPLLYDSEDSSLTGTEPGKMTKESPKTETTLENSQEALQRHKENDKRIKGVIM